MADLSEQAALAKVVDRLTNQYSALPPDRVSAAVLRAYALFEQSRIRDFVPLFVERRARVELANDAMTASAEAPHDEASAVGTR